MEGQYFQHPHGTTAIAKRFARAMPSRNGAARSGCAIAPKTLAFGGRSFGWGRASGMDLALTHSCSGGRKCHNFLPAVNSLINQTDRAFRFLARGHHWRFYVATAITLSIGLIGVGHGSTCIFQLPRMTHWRNAGAVAVATGTASIGGSVLSWWTRPHGDCDRPSSVTSRRWSDFGYTFCPDVCPLDALPQWIAVDCCVKRPLDVCSAFIFRRP